jgi:hypothetical protein
MGERMENKEHRRKSKRHPVRRKAAVVFDKADGKPILHTETEDLSIGGTAIHSNYSDLTGSLVTLLLAQPVRHGGEAPKMLKIRARVVSSVHLPAISGFRHGLSFVRSKDDGLEILAQILGAAESARPGGEWIPAAHSAATPAAPAMQSAPSGGGRLARLKQLALAKRLGGKKSESQEEINARVSGALERAFRYLKEFTELLNIVKPAYAKEYAIVGVPKFDGLTWEDGRIDFRSRETSPTTKVCELVTLHFRLSGNKQLRVTRDSPADEKLKQVLLETMIKFTTQEERNERGSILRTMFVLPCQVEASLHLVGNFDTGKLLLRTRNIDHFSMLGHVLAPEAITEESLDELTGFILGESSRIGPLLLKNA